MPTLVWKLLRQHISIGQLAGFFLANLFGMMIVLLSVQFYKDVIPVRLFFNCTFSRALSSVKMRKS